MEKQILPWERAKNIEKIERLKNLLEEIIEQQARITYKLAPMIFKNQIDCIEIFKNNFKEKLGLEDL